MMRVGFYKQRRMQSEELRNRRTGDVGVEDADPQMLAPEPQSQHRGDQRLSDAALARHDRHDVRDFGATRERAGSAPGRRAVFGSDRRNEAG